MLNYPRVIYYWKLHLIAIDVKLCKTFFLAALLQLGYIEMYVEAFMQIWNMNRYDPLCNVMLFIYWLHRWTSKQPRRTSTKSDLKHRGGQDEFTSKNNMGKRPPHKKKRPLQLGCIKIIYCGGHPCGVWLNLNPHGLNFQYFHLARGWLN
jgi:hypothetical protein